MSKLRDLDDRLSDLEREVSEFDDQHTFWQRRRDDALTRVNQLDPELDGGEMRRLRGVIQACTDKIDDILRKREFTAGRADEVGLQYREELAKDKDDKDEDDSPNTEDQTIKLKRKKPKPTM
jgi:hypothetical protein